MSTSAKLREHGSIDTSIPSVHRIRSHMSDINNLYVVHGCECALNGIGTVYASGERSRIAFVVVVVAVVADGRKEIERLIQLT